jgi:plastocyanin
LISRFKKTENIMLTLLSRLSHQSFIATAAAFVIACGGGGGGPKGPADPVLTSLAVTPTSATLFNAAPGNTVGLTVVAKDQNGSTLVGVGSLSFSSDNTAAATVSGNGTITAIAGGTARITTTMTLGSATRSATTTITVEIPPVSADVTAPQLAFLPAIAHVRAGGTVTWTIAAIPHTVTFTSAGAPASTGTIQNASEARTFPTSGSFSYACSLHAGMAGTVHVH